MSENITKRNPIYWFHWTVVILLMFGFGHLPPIYPLEYLGMQVLGIFLGLIYGWTALDFVFPSLLGMIALGLTEYDSMTNVFKAGFGNNIFLMVFFMFIWSDYLHKSGTLQYIACFLITRKFVMGRPWVFTFMLFLAAWLMGSLLAATAAILIMWTIFYSICEIYGYEPGETYPAYVLVGIAFGVMVGFCVFPYKSIAAMLVGSLNTVAGIEMPFSTFMFSSIVTSFACCILYFLFGKFILKPDVSKISMDEEKVKMLNNNEITTEIKIGFASIIALLIMVILPEYFSNPLFDIFKKMGVTAITTFILIVLGIVKVGGKYVFNFSECVKSSTVSWPMLIMLASTFAVSGAFTSSKVNILALVNYYGIPLFENMLPLAFTILFAVFLCIVTQIAHNAVLAAAFGPVLCQLGMSLGANLILCVILCNVALMAACATPAASSPGALIYSNDKWISRKQSYGFCFVAIVATIIVLIVLGSLLYNIL